MNKQKYVLVIAGPTAVGKTSLAIQVAKTYNTEIINADSRQVFQKMDIGTAKPTRFELNEVKHHFVDELNLDQPFSAGDFEREALKRAETLFVKHDVLVLSGGSGLYIDAFCDGFNDIPEIPPSYRKLLIKDFEEKGLESLVNELKGYDPDYYKLVDLNNSQRIIRALEVIRFTGKPFTEFRNLPKKDRPFQVIKIALERPRDELYDRINKRMDLMIEEGLFKEAELLYPWRSNNALQTVGYQEIFGFMDGEYDHGEAVRLLKRNSRRYAKRQLTWLRKDPDYTWFNPEKLRKGFKVYCNKIKCLKL